MKKHTRVRVLKVYVKSDKVSDVEAGSSHIGYLEYDLKSGNPIKLNEGMNSTPVTTIVKTGDQRFLAETTTSVYLIEAI